MPRQIGSGLSLLMAAHWELCCTLPGHCGLSSQPGCLVLFGAAHSEPAFCRICKIALHSQLAKPQHSNITWDQVLLEQNMAFHINFHSASPFCRAQPGGVGGGEDRAGHPVCLCCFPGCLWTQTLRESSSLMLPSSPVISTLPQEQVRDPFARLLSRSKDTLRVQKQLCLVPSQPRGDGSLWQASPCLHPHCHQPWA